MAAKILRIPASVGELFDKIAILEIKAARITEAAKRSYVTKELALLRELEPQLGPQDVESARLVIDLKQTNEALWDVENAIRDCERHQDFGTKFIALARSVYKLNDHRSAVKRQLNLLHNSEIVEEKSYGS